MSNIVRFDCYEVDLPAGQIYKRGRKLHLREKSFQILATFLEHPGEVVTRETLRQHLWREDVFVDFENNLNAAIARLREVLGDSADHPRFIETLPRHGYRFLASVSAADTSPKERQDAAAYPPFLREPVRSSTAIPYFSRLVHVEDLDAYNEYILGRRILDTASFDRTQMDLSMQHFERAIALNPDLAIAHDGLAELSWYMGYLGLIPPRKAFASGIAHALRALEIDSSRAETHALLGQFQKSAEYNWPEVHREMALALQMSPNSPLIRMRYAVSELMPQGRLEEAIAELDFALESDPLNLLPRGWLGIMLVLSRRYERGMTEARAMLDIDSHSAIAHFVLALCHAYCAKFDEAIFCQSRAIEFSGDSCAMYGWLGLIHAFAGQSVQARDILDRLRQKALAQFVPPTSFAWVHIGLKEYDAAFEWLDRAVEECDQLLMPIKSYRFLDAIRTDPRFISLLQKMQLA